MIRPNKKRLRQFLLFQVVKIPVFRRTIQSFVFFHCETSLYSPFLVIIACTKCEYAGIDSIAMEMTERKLTVIGTMDPVSVVSKLRKNWPTTDIILVGPAKEPEKEKKDELKKEEEKKDEPKKEGEAKKEEPKKEEEKKDEAKKDEPKKEEGKKEEEKKPDPVLELVKAYRAYNPQMTTSYYVQSIEENPNACTIC